MDKNNRDKAMLTGNVPTTESKRYGEDGNVPPRRKRIYTDGKNWYFLTRNGGNHGPFKTFTEAKSALKLFMRRSGIVSFSDDPSRF
jgi:hypothetical protein